MLILLNVTVSKGSILLDVTVSKGLILLDVEFLKGLILLNKMINTYILPSCFGF